MSEPVTVEEFDALPVGSVIKYYNGVAVREQKKSRAIWRLWNGRVVTSASDLIYHFGPLTLLHRHEAPAPAVSEAEDLAGALALLLYDAHPSYGSTAGRSGGYGGSAITQGCSVVDPPPGDEWARADLLLEPLHRYVAAHPEFDLAAAKVRVKREALAALGIRPLQEVTPNACD